MEKGPKQVIPALDKRRNFEQVFFTERSIVRWDSQSCCAFLRYLAFSCMESCIFLQAKNRIVTFKICGKKFIKKRCES